MFTRVASIVAILMAVTIGCGTGASAQGGQRHALIVGITEYPNLKISKAKRDLPNAEEDAKAIRNELLDEFNTTTMLLGSREREAHSTRIVGEWTKLISKANNGDTVLFYFAGHGIELKGRNFLIAQDAHFDPGLEDRLSTVTKNSIDFQNLIVALGKVQKLKPKMVGVFIIDACRENPFRIKEQIDTELGHGVDLPDGLKAILAPREVFIMYSAGVQQQALDGLPGEHSIYARNLLQILRGEQRHWPLSAIAQSLRYSVYAAAVKAGHLQTPAYYDQLTTPRYLVPPKGNQTQPGLKDGDQYLKNTKLPVVLRGFNQREVLWDCKFCPEVVVVPETHEFSMGSSDEARHEGPKKNIRVAKKFAIGRFEVTNREWNACVRDGACAGPEKGDPNSSRLDRMPVTGVSWQDAQGFVKWLNKVTDKRYRLPTEAEWEYAARAPMPGLAKTPYSFGNIEKDEDKDKVCEHANGADRRVGPMMHTNVDCDDDVGREAAPVGLYRANRFGLFDVHGNVWEWVQDCWSPDHSWRGEVSNARDAYKPKQNTTSCSGRVVKGGSWRSGLSALRSAARNTFPSSHSRATVGFRVVRELD